MLIIERQQGEVILLCTSDGDILIGLASTPKKDVARIAIQAPEEIRVFRAESYQRIHGGQLIRVQDMRSGK